MSVTVHGEAETAAALAAIPARLAVNVVKAVRVTCHKVRDDARGRVTGHRYLPAYPFSITYDVHVGPEVVEGEIGPDKARAQGPLGNLIEYGSSKNAPLPHLGPALDANADDLQRGLEIAVQQALG